MKKFLAFFLLLIAGHVHAQQIMYYEFDASGNSRIRAFLAGWEYLPGHPWDPQAFQYGVASATKPAGVTTHAMSFWFRSNGYFSSHPEDSDHIAVLLKGTWSQGFNQGRGIIILGDSPTNPNGLDPSSTFQTWDYTTKLGGHVWYDRFQTGLHDYTDYQVTINVNQNISYEIRDAAGNVVTGGTVTDTYTPNLPPDLGGWFIAATNSSHTTNWNIQFWNLTVGWF